MHCHDTRLLQWNYAGHVHTSRRERLIGRAKPAYRLKPSDRREISGRIHQAVSIGKDTVRESYLLLTVGRGYDPHS